MLKDELHNHWMLGLDGLPDDKEPAKVGVMLHNDDFTPMDFVLKVLKKFFFLEEGCAKKVMLKAHTEGKACIGWFVKDVAETKAEDVNRYAKEEEYPLMCSTEVAT